MSWMMRWVRWQVHRPWQVIVLTLLISLPALWLALQLKLNSGFDALLPDNKASVPRIFTNDISLNNLFHAIHLDTDVAGGITLHILNNHASAVQKYGARAFSFFH